MQEIFLIYIMIGAIFTLIWQVILILFKRPVPENIEQPKGNIITTIIANALLILLYPFFFIILMAKTVEDANKRMELRSKVFGLKEYLETKIEESEEEK